MTPPGERSPNPSEPPSPGARSRPHSPAAPLFVWLVLQMAVLVLAAQWVPLSARFPQDAKRLAVPYVEGRPPPRMKDPHHVAFPPGEGLSF